MKIKNLMPLVFGAAVGYVLGSAAGRGRYEQLKQGASNLIKHPRVQQTVFDVAGDVKDNAGKMPGPVADLVDTAATRLQESLTEPADAAPATQPADIGTAGTADSVTDRS